MRACAARYARLSSTACEHAQHGMRDLRSTTGGEHAPLSHTTMRSTTRDHARHAKDASMRGTTNEHAQRHIRAFCRHECPVEKEGRIGGLPNPPRMSHWLRLCMACSLKRLPRVSDAFMKTHNANTMMGIA